MTHGLSCTVHRSEIRDVNVCCLIDSCNKSHHRIDTLAVSTMFCFGWICFTRRPLLPCIKQSSRQKPGPVDRALGHVGRDLLLYLKIGRFRAILVGKRKRTPHQRSHCRRPLGSTCGAYVPPRILLRSYANTTLAGCQRKEQNQ